MPESRVRSRRSILAGLALASLGFLASLTASAQLPSDGRAPSIQIADNPVVGGLPEVAPVHPGDPRLQLVRVIAVPEVAPVHPGDPRLQLAEVIAVPEVAPVHAGDPRLQPSQGDALQVFGTPEGAPLHPGELRGIP